MFDQLIQKIPENRREAERYRINKMWIHYLIYQKIFEQNKIIKEDLINTENKYYREYLNNNYNLEWLFLYYRCYTKRPKSNFNSDIRDHIREQLEHKLFYTDTNKLNYSKHHKDADAQAEYKGDSEYQNILYNGSRRTYKDMGITINLDGSEDFDLNQRIKPLNRPYATIDSNIPEYETIEENTLKIDAKNTSSAFV